MKLFVLFFALFFALTSASFGDEKADVKALAIATLNQVIDTLQTPSLSETERNAKIITLVDPLFDFKRIAIYCLGVSNYRSFSKAQRKEFVKLFITRLQNSYLKKLNHYSNERVIVGEAVQIKKTIRILTYLIYKGENREMVYKFYRSKTGAWKIYDIEVIGVSFVKTYQAQFTELLAYKSIEEILAQLRSSAI